MALFRTLLVKHPLELDTELDTESEIGSNVSGHPALIQDLLEVAYASRQNCVDKAIAMIADLQQNGPECRFLKPLFGSVAELKSRTAEGGARVYLFRATRTIYGLCRFECKHESEADQNMLFWTAEVAAAYGKGHAVIIGEKS
jgi:hypothetical protein